MSSKSKLSASIYLHFAKPQNVSCNATNKLYEKNFINIVNYNFNTSFCPKIPIQILPSGHIIAKAKIEGKEGNFIFDTGGGINLFFDSFAKDLKQKTTYNFLTAYRATGERIDAPIYENEDVNPPKTPTV